jgi:hypothetical protein
VALAYHFLHYAEIMGKPGTGMRAMSDPLIIAGPMQQPLRGIPFASVFYPLRERLFGGR